MNRCNSSGHLVFDDVVLSPTLFAYALHAGQQKAQA
jgi:hypothetical protein